MSGRNMTNACFNAGQNVPGASNALCRANFRNRGGGVVNSLPGWVGFNTVAISSTPCQGLSVNFPSIVIRRCGLATERNRTQVFRDWSKRCYGKKQKSANYYNGPQQQETERRRVIAQSPQTERRRFLCSEARGHGDGRDNRQVSAENHYQGRRDIPWNECWRRARIADQTAGCPKSIKCRSVIRGGRRELVHDLGEPVGTRITYSLGTPVASRKVPSGKKNHDRVNQKGDHRELHLASLDLFTQILRGSSHHHPSDEESEYQKEQHINHPHTLPAKDAIQPHTNHGR